MPDDDSGMAEGYYDPWARTAWLLVTSRSLGADPAYADRATFVDALNDAGVNADSSRVSRWESGQHAVSFRALRGYETVLGLPEGALVAANRQLVRDCEASAKPPEKVSFAGHDQRSPDVMVSDLVDRATDKDDHLTGGDWLRLATELERFELVLLSNRTWSLVCERLLHELARTSGVDQLRRFEALSTLVTHPVAQRHVLHALGVWLTDPDVQVVFPMLTVLQQLEDPGASNLVCRLMDAPSGQLARGAIQVAAAKLARGHIGRAHLAQEVCHGGVGAFIAQLPDLAQQARAAQIGEGLNTLLQVTLKRFDDAISRHPWAIDRRFEAAFQMLTHCLAVTANFPRDRGNAETLFLQIMDQNDLPQSFHLPAPVSCSFRASGLHPASATIPNK